MVLRGQARGWTPRRPPLVRHLNSHLPVRPGAHWSTTRRIRGRRSVRTPGNRHRLFPSGEFVARPLRAVRLACSDQHLLLSCDEDSLHECKCGLRCVVVLEEGGFIEAGVVILRSRLCRPQREDR